MGRGRRRLLALAAVVLLTGALVRNWPVRARAAFYGAYRDWRQSVAVAGTPPEYLSLAGDHFQVLYPPGDGEGARMVLAAAEAAYGPVVERLGYAPPGPALVVVEPDRDSLRRRFGWPQEESATGVYYGGVIRVLSPSAWFPGQPAGRRADLYRKLNPLTHEFTHYVLDYLTEGNYPRWFTEGLAQHLEHEVTGYRWLEPGSTLRQRLYTLAELEQQFDRLPNQALAYHQALLLVQYLDGNCGEDPLRRLVHLLAQGLPMSRALRRACDLTPGRLEHQWREWVQSDLDLLDRDVPR